MRDFIIMLLICSVTMSALAMSYIGVTPFLAKRYSSAGRYYAWLIIVIGLIIPFRPRSDNPFVKIITTDSAPPTIQLGNGMQMVTPIGKTLSHAALSGISFTWWQIGMAVWLIGMMTFLIYHGVKHCRFMKMTRRWSEMVTDRETTKLLKSIRTELGISKEIRLYRCEIVGTPMLVYFIHPRILLPDTIFEKDQLRLILKHELVHYKRKDLCYKCLVLFAAAIHWFNPLMHLITREIDILCEMSCDSEVVKLTDAHTRLQYSEAIIGVLKYQSKMKTTLSTNFNGGKEGMKKRIYSIMDTRSKKTGTAILCAVLIITMGTGYTFAAQAESNHQPEYIKEDIVISPDSDYGYKFLPDPDIYAKYSSYGVSISDNGEMLLYNGQKIRLFVDEFSDAEAFYYDDAGTVNLSVARNSTSEITGINTISLEAAQKYCSAFFADDNNNDVGTSVTNNSKNGEADTIGTKYEQYSPYGIAYTEEDNMVYFNGQRVRLLVDERNGAFDTFWFDESGMADLSVARNSSGQITEIELISKEQAQNYIAAANENEKDAVRGLAEKVAERLKEM